MKPRITHHDITYHGICHNGMRVFTCMIDGRLKTHRVMGYNLREAKRIARSHFNSNTDR